MTIDRSELERIAELARLELEQEELAQLTRDCRAILDYFAAIRDLGVAGTEPWGAQEGSAALREDRVHHDPLTRPLDGIAPAWRDGYFTLPRLPAMDAELAAEGDES